ncbi:MAG: glycosyltransferase family 4 protein [Magnetococcales bacterium]|nr:glycosyltransferase family 4 protein [Magnetococcales bacterium]
MRILALLTDAYGALGGIAQYNRDLLDALVSAFPGVTIDLLLRKVEEPPGPLPANIRWPAGPRGLGKGAFLAAALRAGLAARPTLILCGHVNLVPPARLLGALTGAPVVLLCYGIEVWQPADWLARRALTGLAAFVAISQVTVRRLQAWSGLPDHMARLLPNALHPEDYRLGDKPDHLLQRYGLSDQNKVVMTFGRLVSRKRAKGFDEILEILPRLPEVVYLIAGDGPDRPRLETRVRELGLAGRVVFTGRLAEAEKADHYLLADLYAMPSRGEGFGFVLLEAMACGIPVLGSRVDGTREALRDGLLGPLVDPDDAPALLAAVREGLERPRGIPAGLEHFCFDRFVERVGEIFSPWLAT